MIKYTVQVYLLGYTVSCSPDSLRLKYSYSADCL